MERLIEQYKWNHPLDYWRANSPSRRESIKFEDELLAQSKGVEYITRLSQQLGLPSQTVYVSCLFLHRYYSRVSVKQSHPYEITACCVFLACKTEESPRKLRDVAAAILIISQKLTKSIKTIQEENPPIYDQWQRVILQKEGELLETLMFDFEYSVPYTLLNSLVSTLVPKQDQERIGPKAVGFINDSCRTLLSVEITSNELAVVALYWAANQLKLKLPEEWFVEYTSKELIVQSMSDMSEMIRILRNGPKGHGS